MEIPMGRPSADDDLHYKVLHDREGHYSYAYDTSLSPAFLIRSVSQSVSPSFPDFYADCPSRPMMHDAKKMCFSRLYGLLHQSSPYLETHAAFPRVVSLSKLSAPFYSIYPIPFRKWSFLLRRSRYVDLNLR